jgi:hypothetical protein
MIDSDKYLEFFSQEYLTSYISRGGTTTKFVLPPSGEEANFVDAICSQAQSAGYLVARIDSATSKAQMIEQIFFGIARQIDWQKLANSFTRIAAHSAGYPVPNDDQDLSLAMLAFSYGADEREVKRDINIVLQQRIFNDYSMVGEFRIAMMRLCQYELKSGQVTELERDSIIAWLEGSLRQISLLKSALIFRKISRSNARAMLFSLSRWIVANGYEGFLLTLDIRQFQKLRKEPDIESPGIIYSRNAVMDAYESLRQLIDNADEFSNFATIVVISPEFLSDESRGLSAYQALKLRIYDEVRDKNRDNPYSSLISLSSSTAEELSQDLLDGNLATLKEVSH